jgi:SMI1 / KNR4 family (SUKH-1)
MSGIKYIVKNPPCKSNSIELFSRKTNATPPGDFVNFCLTDNGGQVAPAYCDYLISTRYPSSQFTENRMIGLQWLCGMGINDTTNFQSVEENEEKLKFLRINSSDFWIVGIGEGNDGYLMSVSRKDCGKMYYCFFDSGEFFLIADSFSTFLKTIETKIPDIV